MKNGRTSKRRPVDARLYQELLLPDWTEETLREVLELAARQLGENGHLSENDGAEVEELRAKLQALIPLLGSVDRKLRIRSQLTKPIPTRKATGQRKLAKLALHSSRLLCAQWMELSVNGDEAFLKDVQSLLFLCVLDFLLPKLDREEMKEERALVVASLLIHCAVGNSDAPQHQFLLGRLYGYLGIRDAEESALIRATYMTPPDEHDFLTKAQAAWMAMMDHGRVREARDFLLDIYRVAPSAALGEIREMLDETSPPAKKKGRQQPA